MATPETIGDYRILREVGRGGMGVVYEAWQPSLQRRVALKVLPQAFSSEEESISRFHREAVTAARLDHPSVVRIYEFGEADGLHYISMEFIDGETLEDKLRRQTPVDTEAFDSRDRTFVVAEEEFSSDEIAEAPEPKPLGATTTQRFGTEERRFVAWIADAACAVQAAHDEGILHRDLKPQNLLITAEGDVKVADFGLARARGMESLTATGQMMGTPQYMSPEQISDGRRVDERSDLYSLGVTLYRALTGRAPFEADNLQALLNQVLRKDPKPPRKLNPRIPRALETICLRAIAKAPEHRYASCREFARDLRRFLVGEPIQARAQGAITRGINRMRRQPVLSASVAIAIIALLAFVGTLFWGSREAGLRQRDQARKLVAQGLTQALLGNEENAPSFYDDALEEDPRCVEALVLRGLSRWLRTQDQAGAESDLERARSLEEDNPLVRSAYAWWLNELGDRKELRSRMGADDPHFEALDLDAMGYLADVSGRHLDAVRYFDRALKRQRGRLSSLIGYARSCAYLARYEDARRRYGTVIDLAPEEPRPQIQFLAILSLELETAEAPHRQKLIELGLNNVQRMPAALRSSPLVRVMTLGLEARSESPREGLREDFLQNLARLDDQLRNDEGSEACDAEILELAALAALRIAPEQALLIARRVIECRPRSRIAPFVVAQLLVEGGEATTAKRELLLQWRKIPEAGLMIHFACDPRVRNGVRSDELPPAAELARTFFETRPDDPAMLARAARVLAEAGESRDARLLAEVALERFQAQGGDAAAAPSLESLRRLLR